MEWITNNMEWISAVIVAIVACIGGIITAIINKKPKEKQPSNSNSNSDNLTTNVNTTNKNSPKTGDVSINVVVNSAVSEPPKSTITTPIEESNDYTKRYLRRRCRYTPIGSKKFKEIITDLATLKIVDSIDDYNEKIRELRDTSFEQKIAEALYNENIGNIDNMAEILNSIKLTEKKESVRLLFLGIAHEKLDKIDEAINCYNKILEDENNVKLRKSAQFNIMLCKEKNGDRRVNFTKFFNERTILHGNQRIKDKALTMHLIVCQKYNMHFTYENLLQESLQYELAHNPTGYIKTQLSYNDLTGISLTQETITNFKKIASTKSINARVAILVNIHNRISDVQLREEIKETLNNLKKKYKDQTIEKYIKELNNHTPEEAVGYKRTKSPD